jgi:hypothetical protein
VLTLLLMPKSLGCNPSNFKLRWKLVTWPFFADSSGDLFLLEVRDVLLTDLFLENI